MLECSLTYETHNKTAAMDNIDMCVDISTTQVVYQCSSCTGSWPDCYASSPELVYASG